MAEDRSRILLVEDQAGTRDGLAEALALAGYFVDRFDAGGRALEYLGSGPKPDLILLDLFLRTDMDGWQFAERVRAIPRATGIPIVAMTAAKLGDEERERVRFDAFFFKPLDLRALLRRIEQLLQVRGRGTGAGTGAFRRSAKASA
jgi:CheY-like chemotaxis protein